MNIRHFGPVSERVETGAIQFGDDWPGMFFRGDHCMMNMQMLEAVLQQLPKTSENAFLRRWVEGLRDTFSDAIVTP